MQSYHSIWELSFAHPQFSQAVKHFMPVAYYDAILDNRVDFPKRKKPLSFSADASGVHQPKKRPRAPRPARLQIGGLVTVEPEADVEPDVQPG